MAIKSTFIADFTSFSSAVQGAQVTLKGFEGDANKVGSALNRMTDQFTGRKVQAEATLMAEAFKRLSETGVKFTADELQKMGTVADAAIAKFHVMGQTVPKDIQAMSDASKEASASWSGFVKNFDPKAAIADPLGTAVNAMGALAESMGPVGVAGLTVVSVVTALGAAFLHLTEAAAKVGGTLNDMSQKTGISVPMLSRLSQAAQVAGTDINALSDAVYKMDIQAADSPGKFAKGMERLGLKTKEFLALSPDEKLLALSQALNDTSDASVRNAAGAEIMGKQFKDLGPAILKLNDAMKETAGISVWTEQQAADAEKFEMQIKALKLELADLGIAIGRDLIPPALVLLQWFKDLKEAIPAAFAATPPGMIFHALAQEVGYAGAALSLLRGEFGKLPPVVGDAGHVLTQAERQMQAFWNKALPPADIGKGFDDLNAMWRDQTKSMEGATKVTKKHAAEVIGLGEGEKTLEGVLKLQQEAFQRYYERLEQIIPATRDWNSLLALTPGEIIEVTAALNDFNHVGTKTAIEVLPGLVQGDGIQETTSALREMGDTMQGVAQILTTSQGAIGDIARAYLVAAKAAEDYANATTKAGKATALAAGVGAVAGATGQGSTGSRVAGGAIAGMQIGMIAGPWGAAVGAGVGALVGWIRGRGAEVKAAIGEFNKYFTSSQDALEKTTAAYLKYGHTATEAQQDVQHALDATHKSAQAEAAALKIIQDKIAFGASSFDALTEAIGRYKFSTQELGSVLAKQKLDEQAKQLLSDWNLLTAAGINIAAIGREMGDSINQFQQDAVATGQEVDVALKPMLQKMKEMGLLTDAAGNKIEDFDAAGIHFSMTMSEGFKTVVDAVKEMTAAIKQALGIVDATANAVDKLGDAANNIPDNPFANWDAPTAGRTPDMSSPSFGGGGGGSNLVAFPGRKVPLVTAAQQRAALSGGAGGGPIEITLVTQLDGRVVAETVTRVQDNDQRLRRKIRAA